MIREFYKERSKKSFARYVVWAIFVILAAFGLMHFFMSGAENFILLVKKTYDTHINKSETAPETFIVRAAKEDIIQVNSLPNEGLVLGVWQDKNGVGKKYGETLSMFRGNPTRTWYGSGKIPNNFEIKWRYPEIPMCAESSDKGETRKWCGSGWTGQPVVYEHDEKTEIIFGAYDKKVHFVDAKTGKDSRAPFETGDIIKGSVTLDPDGFPLIYFGSRDNKLRILSLDQDNPKELWSLDSKDLPGIWNDDWDGNPVIIDDHLFTGGENGWFFIVRLNRSYNSRANVEVRPEIIFSMPSYDTDFLHMLGDNNVSIENSVAIYGGVAYFANSGGRVTGVDISDIKNEEARVVFDYWLGDDVDASIVIDDAGDLYVSVEEERLNDRSRSIGQLVKLDPKKKEPLEWSVFVPSKKENFSGGIWATPALYKNNLYVVTNPGELLVVDTNSGEVLWKDEVGIHAWSSPIISSDELLVATCQGIFIKYDLQQEDRPVRINEFQMPGGSCLESTPALFEGNLYFGSRDGFFYKIGEK